MLVPVVVAPIPEFLFQQDTKHFKYVPHVIPTITVWNGYSYYCYCSCVHETSENPRGPVTRQWYSLRSCGLTPEVTPFLLISINIWRMLFERLVSVYNVLKFKIYMWNQPDYCCQSLLTPISSTRWDSLKLLLHCMSFCLICLNTVIWEIQIMYSL